MYSSLRPPRKPRLASLTLAILLLLSLVLSACSASTSTKHSGQNYITIVANTNGDFVRNFNPFSPTPSDGSRGFIYETLLYFNRIDNTVKPWLASSYEFSSDAKTITFKLRQGVKWSDGQAFTSGDVVFTLNLLKKFPDMDGNNIWPFIESVTASDPQTVVVQLKEAFSPILWYVAGQTFILPEHQWSSVGDASKFADPDPIGTGPYILKSFTPQLQVLTKNPNFWQPGKPEVQELRFPAFNSNTSAELVLSSGNLDWTGLYTPNIEKTYIERDKQHNHYWFPPSDVVMLYLNLKRAPFDQLVVRQAISSAIDRNQIYQVAESGYEPPASPTGLLLPGAQSYLSPDFASAAFKFNTQQATQLLESAGYVKGSDGIYAKDGKKLSFTLDVTSGWTDWITGCQIIATNLKAAGIDVKVKTLDFDAYYNALQMGDFDMGMFYTNPGPSPYFIYDSLLRTDNSAPIGQLASSNFERWEDATTDSLLKSYAQTADPAAQKAAIVGLQKIMVDQLPAIPLTNEPYWYEYSTAHFTGWPDQNNPYAVPSPFMSPDCEIVVLNLKPV
jgi:peptide/nickel transport system substrate-binding protein